MFNENSKKFYIEQLTWPELSAMEYKLGKNFQVWNFKVIYVQILMQNYGISNKDAIMKFPIFQI